MYIKYKQISEDFIIKKEKKKINVYDFNWTLTILGKFN